MGLMDLDGPDPTGNSNIVDNAWRGAEAYHFLMLCQRQLYEGMDAQANLIVLLLCTL